MNQYKRLLGNTFIFAIGTFSSKILVILMLRFYTGMMTQDEMGVADLIIKTTSILYPVVSLSIGQAVIRYGLERKYYKRSVFTIALVTVLCGFIIALPFHPLLSLIHYNTSAGVTGSLLEYQWIIYLYVLTSCTQNVCSQFIRALGHVRLYAIDGIFRTFVTIMLNILYLKVFRWNILGYVLHHYRTHFHCCLFIIAGLWKYAAQASGHTPVARNLAYRCRSCRMRLRVYYRLRIRCFASMQVRSQRHTRLPTVCRH
ncbi:MAG: lipopolysaccharide biosynthesis protein [Butyricicoccus sp.]